MKLKSLRSIFRTAWHALRLAITLALATFLLGGAAVPTGGLDSALHSLTRDLAFDFAGWTLEAAASKLAAWGLSLERFLTPQQESQWVLDALEQVRRVNALSAEIALVYADPDIANPDAASAALRQDLAREQARLDALLPTAESVLQAQLLDVLNDIGLNLLGQVIPPSLYQTSAIPSSLIVSPRDRIAKSADIYLTPGLPTKDRARLEGQVFTDLDHSALVVPIGGIGSYPTMVMQTDNLVWLTEVIAHEWTHNYLTLRPLGINYETTPELRTINETAASLAGKELGLLILEKYYPDLVPPKPEPDSGNAELARPEPEPPAFDFNAEMRITRVEVDRLLAEGKIEEAEAYMEARRAVFWEHGFPIRVLNQAYFAFHGAYSDEPGGAAGEDPVGPAVVAFRERFDSLSDFLRAISWVNSYGELLELLES